MKNDKIVIFGGTFNPVHNGHIIMLKNISSVLNPDKIIVVPANIPAHKKITSSVTSKDRFNMCKLAFGYDKKIEVSDIEINRRGISYTIDTIKQLKKIYKSSDLYLTVGADMFMCFQSWKNPSEILNEVSLCVVPRDDIKLSILESQKKYLEKIFSNVNIILIQSNCVDISSTQIRNAVIKDESIENFVPKEIKEYIYLNNLYRKER